MADTANLKGPQHLLRGANVQHDMQQNMSLAEKKNQDFLLAQRHSL